MLLYIKKAESFPDTLLILQIMQDPAHNPVSKYPLKMNKDSKDYEEQVEVDTEKEI